MICGSARSRSDHVFITLARCPKTVSNRYIAHGESGDPYWRMLGAEFITHGREPRLQTRIDREDPKFPGLEA